MANLKFAIVAIAATMTLAAQENRSSQSIPAEVAEEINKDVMTRIKNSARSRINETIKAYCRERNIVIGKVRPDGTFYLSAIEAVGTNQKDSGFIKSRALTYVKAYNTAITEYVMDQCGKNSVTLYGKFFRNNDSNMLQPSVDIKTTQQRIAEKTEMLTEAQLDQGLKAMGVMPSGSIVEKRKLAVDSILIGSMKQAFGSAAGLLPVRAFEGWDDNGNYAIGVVMRGGIETATLADCISSKRRPVLSRPEKGMSVEKALPSDDELVSQFGVRLFFDETGTPALLSFGQGGLDYSGNDDIELEQAIKAAEIAAQELADNLLSIFINSTIFITNNSKQGDEFVRSVMFDANGGIKTDTVRNLIDNVSRESEARAMTEMRGSSTVRKEIIKHPQSGQPIAVCVRMWSFGQYEAMKRIEKRPNPNNIRHNSSGPLKGGVRCDREYDF